MAHPRVAARLTRMVERPGPNRIALVTDDDGLVRRVVGMALESDGWTVVEAADAEAERDALARMSVELCVMDRHLPGQALEARLADVALLRPRAAVVVLSGDPETVVSGAVQLVKPVELEAFQRGVERAVGIARTSA